MKSGLLEETSGYHKTLFKGIRFRVGSWPQKVNFVQVLTFLVDFFVLINERYTKNCVDVFVVSPTGPGLAIRIICGDEPYQGSDFAETNIILGQIVDFVTAIKKVCIKSVFLVTVDVGVRNTSLRGNIAGGYVFYFSFLSNNTSCAAIFSQSKRLFNNSQTH